LIHTLYALDEYDWYWQCRGQNRNSKGLGQEEECWASNSKTLIDI